MLKETEWARDKYVPTRDEYMSNAYVSFALGPIVLPTLYFVGHKLSNEVVHHFEVHNLFKLMSTCGRLLNDIQSFKVNMHRSSWVLKNFSFFTIFTFEFDRVDSMV